MVAKSVPVEKVMKDITTLSLARWIVNQDKHATKIKETVWQYFMARRMRTVVARETRGYMAYC